MGNLVCSTSNQNDTHTIRKIDVNAPKSIQMSSFDDLERMLKLREEYLLAEAEKKQGFQKAKRQPNWNDDEFVALKAEYSRLVRRAMTHLVSPPSCKENSFWCFLGCMMLRKKHNGGGLKHIIPEFILQMIYYHYVSSQYRSASLRLHPPGGVR